MLRLFCVFLFLSCSFLTHAQNEWNVWHFGKGAGLDFSTSPPTVVNGGQINTIG